MSAIMALRLIATAPPKQNSSVQISMGGLSPSQTQSIRLRDGEVVVYRRASSLFYPCRYKLADGSWCRQTTGRSSLENAIARACEIYDESRFWQRLGLAHQARSFAHIASICLEELRHLWT